MAEYFQRIISRPILNLADVTNKIASNSDYSIRVNPKGNDEITDLYNRFNEMFEVIQDKQDERDKALKELEVFSSGLEETVKERTVEIQEVNKSLKGERDKAQNYLDVANVIIMFIDMEQNVVMINKTGCKTLGYSEEEILGKNWYSNFIPSDEAKSRKELDKNIINNPSETYEYMENVIITKSGDKRIIGWRNSILYDDFGKQLGMLSSGEDITERKKAEEELNQAKESAEAATVAKSQFLASMSHEIRTPMNAILGLSHLALKTDLNKQQLDYITKIDNSGRSLLGIINDILDFSKIEAGKFGIEEIDFSLEELFNSVSNLISQKAHDKGLEFSIHISKNAPKYLIGDSLRLRQIITNFCGNAVKFTKDGEIAVGVDLEKIEDNIATLKFSVRDTGIGISQNQIDKLFSAFTQADSSTTREYGGTGLGLAISKKLAELLGGTTWVESEVGNGSTFYFTAQLTIQEEQNEDEFLPSIDLRNLNVLVCDDNETCREILKEALESFSFNVTLAESGKEAIELVSNKTENPFDLVLMDWKMPNMDGLETSQIILNQEEANIPTIIMVTAYDKEEIKEKVKEIGIKKTLIKPVSYSTLFDTIMELFGKERSSIDPHKVMGEKYINELEKIKGAKILLTEDNEINQQVAQELLEGRGFFVDIANDGKESVEMIQKENYNIVLMDLQMPVMDGYGATKEIREMKEYDVVPIVAMTADAMVGIKEKCFSIGMQDFVTKPIDPDEMFAAIVKWVKPEDVKSVSAPSRKDESKVEDREKVIIPELDGIDLEDGIRRVAGNKKLYKSLLEKFYNSNIEFEKQIREAVERNDSELSVRLAHTLKGVAGNLGAIELFNISKKLEADLNDNGGENFDSLLAETLTQLNIVLISIKEKILSVIVEEEKKTLSKDELAEKLDELKSLIEGYDSEAINKLREIGVIDGFENEMKELETNTSNYDFDGALEVLKIIMN